MQRGITFALLACLIATVIFIDVLSIWMKIRVNLKLPEDRQLSWWSRNYREVNRIYGEQNPDSILPDLNRYSLYLAMALGAAMILVRVVLRDRS